MIILRVACDNFYMFKNFEVDFTYERKSNHYLSENDRLFTRLKNKGQEKSHNYGSKCFRQNNFREVALPDS